MHVKIKKTSILNLVTKFVVGADLIYLSIRLVVERYSIRPVRVNTLVGGYSRIIRSAYCPQKTVLFFYLAVI